MKQYHYIDSYNQKQISKNEEELLSIIDRNTLIWFEGLSEWTVAENIFKEYFHKLPPPLPQSDKKINLSLSFQKIPSKTVLIPIFLFIVALIINILY